MAINNKRFKIEARKITVPTGSRITYNTDSSAPFFIILNDLADFPNPDINTIAAHQLLSMGLVEIGMLGDLAHAQSVTLDSTLTAGDDYIMLVAHLFDS